MSGVLQQQQQVRRSRRASDGSTTGMPTSPATGAKKRPERIATASSLFSEDGSTCVGGEGLDGKRATETPTLLLGRDINPACTSALAQIRSHTFLTYSEMYSEDEAVSN